MPYSAFPVAYSLVCCRKPLILLTLWEYRYPTLIFERPDWKRLIADIEAGKVGIVLVKDLSRVGRDYLRVGFYTEVTFPQNGVRFTAVNNGVDSANQAENDFAPFLNIMNDFYARVLFYGCQDSGMLTFFQPVSTAGNRLREVSSQ